MKQHWWKHKSSLLHLSFLKNVHSFSPYNSVVPAVGACTRARTRTLYMGGDMAAGSHAYLTYIFSGAHRFVDR